MKRNIHDISLRIEHKRSEVIVREMRYHLQASAPTRKDALAAFWYAFSRTGELLALDEQAGLLTTEKAEQLIYICAVLGYEHNYERQELRASE